MTTDPIMLKAFQPGCTESFEILYSHYKAALVGYAQSIVGGREQAEEVVHDVLMALLKKNAVTTTHTEMKNLLFLSVRNKSLNVARHRHLQNNYVRRHALQLLHHPLHTAKGKQDVIAEEEEMNQLLDSLPVEQREALYLKVFCEYTYAEVAHITGDPLGTIRSRCHAALLRLQPMLKG